MFRYVYSVLLLAFTKPACDHIIRMITKNTSSGSVKAAALQDAKVEGSTASINFQLQKLTTELIKQGKSPEDAVAMLKDASRALRDDIAELRKLVLESRGVAHDDALSLHEENVQIYTAMKIK